ncbi:RluA family pseudouridine synthase [Bythopirellula polymerisocia]|uniref:Ribosomal large subunit pseudouridine synthase A n=1 Tax=Bythopirellula polymerisocia TaxID=2528003 RepID=A0A5C6CUD3_9BACT|nr:RluA family pseudouridine synthase [Bythopirellula polymerisocia]TWU27264.1 Ribosomal large subunit pseudouridine synthase A [Bythopirellula polymerisocia]
MAISANQLEVLYEDNHLLVVNKRAMLPTMGVSEDQPSLIKIAKEYIREKYQKPGNVFLGVVSRLDAPVTGVTLLARTSKAAARLSAAFRDRKVRKSYLAVVAGEVPDASGTLEHYLRKDERHRKVHVTHADCPDAQLARLRYRVLKVSAGKSLLEIELETGRKHQIRVQLAKLGFPIVGDKKYGSQQNFFKGIALHARELEISHPTLDKTITFTAPMPRYWLESPSFAGLF